jgi:hypothetical protein
MKSGKETSGAELNGGSRSVERLVRRLPSEPGFYWWRLNPSEDWRMTQILDFADGIASAMHLAAYDVEKCEWGGRTLKVWADREGEVGEWMKVEKPNDEMTSPYPRKESTDV